METEERRRWWECGRFEDPFELGGELDVSFVDLLEIVEVERERVETEETEVLRE